MKFFNTIKDIFFKINEKIIKGFNEIYDEIKNIENKKRFGIIVCSWILVFISIIFVSKIKEVHDDSNVNVFAEIENVEEKTEAGVQVESVAIKKETMSKNTKTEDSSKESMEESTETQNNIIDINNIEKETIPFENINVVNEQLYDDAIIMTQKNQVIYSEQGKKKSSKNYDEDRFINCIDVSKHQGDIDWKAVKESGIDYAIIRVAYRGYETGKIAKDTRFEKNIKGALANGIEVGVYFFSQATNRIEALEEASVILEYIKGYDITLPVVIDWETAPGYRTYSGIDKNELTEIISIFCDTVSKYGYDPMVYMCQTDFTGRVNGKKLAQKYKIWVAWYFGCYAKSDNRQNMFKYGEDIPDLTYNYNVWQYSKNGYVKGISTPVDMNVYILPEKIPDPVFNVDFKEKIIDYNDKKYDVLSGVKLVDFEGTDITDKVEYIIKDSNFKMIKIEDMILNPGKYVVSYYYADNSSVYKDVTLYVRDIPEIYFDGDKWYEEDIKYMNYLYDNTLSVKENFEIIKTQILSKIEVRKYNLPYGNEYSVIVGDIYNLEKILVDGGTTEKEYEIKYKAKCLDGVEKVRTIRLNVLHTSEGEVDTEDQHEKEDEIETDNDQENVEKEDMSMENKEETTENLGEENIELESNL